MDDPCLPLPLSGGLDVPLLSASALLPLSPPSITWRYINAEEGTGFYLLALT